MAKYCGKISKLDWFKCAERELNHKLWSTKFTFQGIWNKIVHWYRCEIIFNSYKKTCQLLLLSERYCYNFSCLQLLFAAKQSAQLYLGELACGTVMLHGQHPTVRHSSKKPHGPIPVICIDLPVKLHEGSRKCFFRPNWWRGTPLPYPPVPSDHYPVAMLGIGAAPQRLTALTVAGRTE